MLVSGKSIHSRPHVLLRGTAPLANIDMFQGCRGALSQAVRVHHRGEDSKDEPRAAALPASFGNLSRAPGAFGYYSSLP